MQLGKVRLYFPIFILFYCRGENFSLFLQWVGIEYGHRECQLLLGSVTLEGKIHKSKKQWVEIKTHVCLVCTLVFLNIYMMTVNISRLIFNIYLSNVITCLSFILTQFEVCGVVFLVTWNWMGLTEPEKLFRTDWQISYCNAIILLRCTQIDCHNKS